MQNGRCTSSPTGAATAGGGGGGGGGEGGEGGGEGAPRGASWPNRERGGSLRLSRRFRSRRGHPCRHCSPGGWRRPGGGGGVGRWTTRSAARGSGRALSGTLQRAAAVAVAVAAVAAAGSVEAAPRAAAGWRRAATPGSVPPPFPPPTHRPMNRPRGTRPMVHALHLSQNPLSDCVPPALARTRPTQLAGDYLGRELGTGNAIARSSSTHTLASLS